MKIKFQSLLIPLAVLAFNHQSSADIMVTLEPSFQVVSPGSSVFLDLVVSGLGDHASPSLGAFDFDLSYNAAVITGMAVTYGNYLDLGTFGSFQDTTFPSVGLMRLNEVSLESASDLQANQPASFTLARLQVFGFVPGVSPFDFAFGSLSDETGLLSLQFITQGVQVQVSEPSVVRDSGPTTVLLALGAVAIFALRRRTVACVI